MNPMSCGPHQIQRRGRSVIGHIAGIRDVVGFHGESVAALRQAFREAVDEYLDACARIDKSPQKPYSGS